MLTNQEKLYITEHYARWKPASYRYWESLPAAELGNTREEEQVAQAKSRPAIVLIHGYGASVEHYRRTFAGLKNRYRIYALDLVGFGLSEKKNGREVNYSPELWAQQVYDFLAYKGEEKAILVGHSLGGMVSICFSQLYLDKVAGLILIDTAGLPDQGAAELEGARSQGNRNVDTGALLFNAIRTPLVGETLALLMTNRFAAERSLRDAYYNQRKVTPQLIEQMAAPLRTPGARDSYLAITRNFSTYQLKIKPGDIKVPVLIIWGDHDKWMPPATMLPRWRKLIPQAEVYTVESSGHCPQDERPDLVNPQILQFVEKIAGESPATSEQISAVSK